MQQIGPNDQIKMSGLQRLSDKSGSLEAASR